MIKDWSDIRRASIALFAASVLLAIVAEPSWIGMFASMLAGIALASIYWATMCITMRRHLDGLVESIAEFELRHMPQPKETTDAPRIYPAQGKDCGQ